MKDSTLLRETFPPVSPLNKSFFRSTIMRQPHLLTCPTSPVQK